MVVSILVADAQTRLLLGIAIGGVLLCAGMLGVAGTYPEFDETIRFATFQFVSGMTSAGFQTDPGLGVRWTGASMLLITVAMLFGGASGSTAGGRKLIRLRAIATGALYQATSPVDEEATVGATTSEYDQAAAIAVLWIALFLVGVLASALVLAAELGGHELAAVLFEAASAQGNVGLSSGITGPELPTAVKGVLVLQM